MQADEALPPVLCDAHTHFLPKRLASKVRSFFEDYGLASQASACCSSDSTPGLYPVQEDDLLAELIADADQPRRCWSLPYAHKAGMAHSLNEQMTKLATELSSKSKGKLIVQPGFTVHPLDGSEGVRQTAQVALATGSRVCKLHCSVSRLSVLDGNLAPLWELAQAHRFPTVVHVGTSIMGVTESEELAEIDELAGRYPDAIVVIAHSGHPAVRRSIELARKHNNVYLDTTPVVVSLVDFPDMRDEPELHEKLLQLARQGRVLFGSDVPNVAIRVEDQVRDVVRWTSGDSVALDMILGGAAKKLLDGFLPPLQGSSGKL
ncbi:hypothetical protein E5Q_03741 [Mixia osmundae IAM 14324]|uniref:Amidohydrolase-related domain-containing protein n=1 Tax=Mixia osmundae (strain CBS 9802 / IAM 14324 / JCM 22182 / KY 12970) TaxID=764103 RepID=G7E2K6_MIXOS|nr:hypothetical protein E5Q_03741 [Mixia osmundae IAM 14324]